MRQAYDYWQDQPGNYPTDRETRARRPRETPLHAPPQQKEASILSHFCQPGGQSDTKRTPSVEPCDGNPLYLCHVFRPLHPRKLQAYRLDSQGLRNAQKILQGRTSLRILAFYAWPKAIRYNNHPFSRCPAGQLFATGSVISSRQRSKSTQLYSFSL